MKLRINGNSVRLRLTPKEVHQLVKKGSIQDVCTFPGSQLTYGILSSDGNEISIEFVECEVKVIIPKEQLIDWDSNEQVGFEHTTESGFYILVEKDFKCLKPRKHEDESKLYTNPNA